MVVEGSDDNGGVNALERSGNLGSRHVGGSLVVG